VVAGFWNYKFVDGLGQTLFAGPLIGDSHAAAARGDSGLGFGMLFGAAAGLAASFTACNCVVYAMLPGLACPISPISRDRGDGSMPAGPGAPGTPGTPTKTALRALALFTAAVVLVCSLYGLWIGLQGTGAVAHLASTPVRLRQAEVVFSAIGVVMLAWGLMDMGVLFGGRNRGRNRVRSALQRPAVRASLLGLLVGLFAIGRPYPVFYDLLSYTARSGNPLAAALIMAAQGIGQVLLMAILLIVVIGLFGRRLSVWMAATPTRAERLSAFALTAGGAYFIFYWGVAFLWNVGRWGFQLGWYR
jgi:hypothetical protein